MRLLLVEDENSIANPLKNGLAKRGYSVDIANDGLSGLSKAQINQYDCIILDINLPKLDGLTLSKRLRADKNKTPILMLTARTLQNNVYEGFEAGTDDYLTKPFDFQELLYRIEALINRNIGEFNSLFKAGNITLDTKALKATINNVPVKLNLKEYGVLEYLMKNSGRVISQEELLEHVWDEEIDSFTQTVRTNIKTLRKKVDPNKHIIKTFKGKGYIIEK